jgi:hypothetical protein
VVGDGLELRNEGVKSLYSNEAQCVSNKADTGAGRKRAIFQGATTSEINVWSRVRDRGDAETRKYTEDLDEKV